jgi:hypothetical protein
LARRSVVLSTTTQKYSPNHRKGVALQLRVTPAAKLRIIAAAERKSEEEGGNVPRGRIVSELAMAHLPPAPQERLTPARPGGGLRAATG